MSASNSSSLDPRDDAHAGVAGAIETFLAQGVGLILDTRREDWARNPSTRPAPGDVGAIIRNTAAANATIAGAVSLIPGPLGMAAAIPEILAILANQIRMVIDLAAACGKDRQLTPSILLALLANTVGGGGVAYLAVHGNKVLIRRASLRFMQDLIKRLGGNITQRALRGMVAKWFPVAGAAAMAVWAGWSTRAIGRYAREVLSKEWTVEA